MSKVTFVITILHVFTPLSAEPDYTLFSSLVSRKKSFKHFLNKTVKFPVLFFLVFLSITIIDSLNIQRFLNLDTGDIFSIIGS